MFTDKIHKRGGRSSLGSLQIVASRSKEARLW